MLHRIKQSKAYVILKYFARKKDVICLTLNTLPQLDTEQIYKCNMQHCQILLSYSKYKEISQLKYFLWALIYG
jgi:hypothetical protein